MWMTSADDIMREIEESGFVEMLSDRYDAVASKRDDALLADNPDRDAILEALVSVLTTMSVDLGLTSDPFGLLAFISASDFLKAILLGAYCMGYKRGQGKGLTLVVRDEGR
jgi:hypothetical protein